MKALIKKDLILTRFNIAITLLYFPVLLLVIWISISIAEDVMIANAFFISFIVVGFVFIYAELLGKDNGSNTYTMLFSMPIDKSKFVLSKYISLAIIAGIESIIHYGAFVGLSLNNSNLMKDQKMVFDIVPLSISICMILVSFMLPFDFRKSFYGGVKQQSLNHIISVFLIMILVVGFPFIMIKMSDNMLIVNIFRSNMRLSSYIFVALAMIFYFVSYRISKIFFDKANMIVG